MDCPSFSFGKGGGGGLKVHKASSGCRENPRVTIPNASFFFFSFHGTFATTRVKIYVLYKKKGGNLFFFLYIFISKIWEISCSCSQEFCDICALFPNSFSLFSFLSRFYFLSLSSSPPLQYEENKAAKRPRKEKKKKKRDRTF